MIVNDLEIIEGEEGRRVKGWWWRLNKSRRTYSCDLTLAIIGMK